MSLNASNQELTALNEEAVSLNEEFQSTNEELETSREELQSLNEELTTANSQLQESLEQQRNTSTDLKNILNSSQIATLFLDREFKVRYLYAGCHSRSSSSLPPIIGRPLTDLAIPFIGRRSARGCAYRARQSHADPARGQERSREAGICAAFRPTGQKTTASMGSLSISPIFPN